MSKLEKVFEGNWNEIKGKLKEQWGKLTDNDIIQIDGSYEGFLDKLQKSYGSEAEKIEEEIADFFTSQSFEKANGKTHAFINDALEKTENIKKIAKECLNEYYEKIKDTSIVAEEKLVSYCRANPLKTMSLAALTGFALAIFFVKRKN